MGWTPTVQLVRPKDRNPYYRMTLNGKQHYLGSNAADAYRKAEAMLRGTGLSLGPQGERGPTVCPEFVADLLRVWQDDHPGTFHREVTTHWAEWAGQMRLADIGADHLERFLRYLETVRFRPGGPKNERTTPRRLSAWSIQKYVRYPWSVLKWAHGKGWIPQIPVLPRLPKPMLRPRDVRPDDLIRAFERLPERSGLILRFIVETGCRPSEASSLQWEDVDMERGVCVLSQHKTAHRGRVRTIYLNPAACSILEQTPESRRHGRVFTNRYGKAYTAAGLRSVLREHGIKGAYQLRHTFAQNALDKGVALEDVAKLLGHSDLRTVQTYAQVRDNRARSVAASLISALPALQRTSVKTSIAESKTPEPQQEQTRATA